MAWRSVIISNPARLQQKHGALVVDQDGQSVSVPLEDIAVLIIDNPRVTLTSALLSACADRQLAVVSVDKTHNPNGIFLPYLSHSRALKVMRQQLAMTLPHKKRLWQVIVKQKLLNQSTVAEFHNQQEAADKLRTLACRVRSGDAGNLEAWGAQIYFVALFGKEFSRGHKNTINATINYGYAIVRSALARSLTGYGFLPAFGIHHSSEQNRFNLADDLLEPYRAVVDAHLLEMKPSLWQLENLDSQAKASIAGILHNDISRIENGEEGKVNIVGFSRQYSYEPWTMHNR